MRDLALVRALDGVPDGPRERFLGFHARHRLRRLELSGHALEYVAFGQGERVLLHLPGLLSDARAAVHLASLADRFCILSLTYLDTTDVAAQLEAIARLLDAEDAGAAVIVGQTLGGYLGQLFAAAHPTRVSHLVLAHAGLPEPGQMPKLDATRRVVQLLPHVLGRAFVTRTLLAGVARASRHPDVDAAEAQLVLAYFRFRQAGLSRRTMLARYGLACEIGRAFPRYRDGLAAWPGRTLALYGEGAWCNERHVARLHEVHGDVEALRVDAGGHWNLYLQPEAAARAISAFVGGPHA